MKVIRRIRSILNNINWKFREKGLKETYDHIRRLIKYGIKVLLNLDDKVQKRRLYLSNKLDHRFQNTIHYGYFKGMKLPKISWWGKRDRGGILLGLYEKEVLEKIVYLSKEYKIKKFIDIGAADGYYGIGALYSGLFEESYCFEISQLGREVILENAKINNVQDKLKIFGELRGLLSKKISSFSKDRNLILIDIEGAEFNLLDSSFINDIKKSFVIIELHYGYLDNGLDIFSKLKGKLSRFFDLEIITTGSRDLSPIIELENFSDTDKWLLCSEGRRIKGEWLVCIPFNKE